MRILSNGELTTRLNALESAFIHSRPREYDNTNRSEDAQTKVESITPYTETKGGYYGEKEKTFYNVPNGNVSVLFDNYYGSYTVSRVSDRVTISFDTLSEYTNITISVL